MTIRSIWGPVTAVLLPVGLFQWLSGQPSLDMALTMPRGHFYFVSSVALLAVVFAIAVGVTGSRVRNIKVQFLSLAFISLAMLFSVHGMSTPGFLLHATHLPGISAQLSVTLAAFWLYMSSLPSDHPAVRLLARRRALLLPVWSIGLGASGLLAMLYPHVVDFIPVNVRPLNLVLTALTLALVSVTMVRYYRSYQYSRFPLQLAIVYSSGWLLASQWIMVMGRTWQLSWWLYHALLLLSMFVMLAGLVKQYADKQSLPGALRALFTNDPIERITSCISPSVKALMAATERKDPYTAGHNFRVALYALKLAEELALRPEQLRALAHGAIVHDVGKIDVPDAILNKPGRLTPEERAVIELHPVKGYDMCRGLGFLQEELGIIRWHHEQWNGAGYPDRLKGERIPLMARIVAVADVYDALTSHRAYRQAMTHEEAMTFLDQRKGTHFDPACVEAWQRLCARDASVYRDYPGLFAEPPAAAASTG